MLTQSVLAGQFLSGIEEPVLFHEWTAWVILGLSLLQVIFAMVFLRGGGPIWFVFASVFVLLAEALQTGTGYGRFLGVHIPLGVFIFGAVLWQLIWLFAARPSPADGQA